MIDTSKTYTPDTLPILDRHALPADEPRTKLINLLAQSYHIGCGCCADYDRLTVVYPDGWEDEEQVPLSISLADEIIAAGWTLKENK